MDLKKLYREKRFRDITDLLSINIRIEKEENKPIINKIFRNNLAIFSLNAYCWKSNDYKNYKKIKAELKIDNSEKIYGEIKKLLSYKVYEEVIKNYCNDII